MSSIRTSLAEIGNDTLDFSGATTFRAGAHAVSTISKQGRVGQKKRFQTPLKTVCNICIEYLFCLMLIFKPLDRFTTALSCRPFVRFRGYNICYVAARSLPDATESNVNPPIPSWPQNRRPDRRVRHRWCFAEVDGTSRLRLADVLQYFFLLPAWRQDGWRFRWP